MKTNLIILLALCVISGAETADEITGKVVPGLVPYDNGLDYTPEGRRKTALNNAKFHLAHFMAGKEIPEGVRISYALEKLREKRSKCRVFKQLKKPRMNEEGSLILFEVDENGAWIIDDENTKLMKQQLAKEIEILEQRLAEIYDPHKAEQVTDDQLPAR